MFIRAFFLSLKCLSSNLENDPVLFYYSGKNSFLSNDTQFWLHFAFEVWHLTLSNNNKNKIGNLGRHVAAAEEATQRKGTAETFLDVHKSSLTQPSGRTRDRKCKYWKRDLCKFVAEWKETAHSRSCSKLKMISVECTYTPSYLKKEQSPGIDNFNIDKTAPPLY